eukprot:1960394-Prymnesium_polylepis.2
MGLSVLHTPTTASSSSVWLASSSQIRPSTDPEKRLVLLAGEKRTCVTASVWTSQRQSGAAVLRKSHRTTALSVPAASKWSLPGEMLQTSSVLTEASLRVALGAAEPDCTSHTRTRPSEEAVYRIEAGAFAKHSSFTLPVVLRVRSGCIACRSNISTRSSDVAAASRLPGTSQARPRQ